MRYPLIKKCVYHKHVSIERIWRRMMRKDLLILVKGVKIRPDPLPYQNDKRREFCSRYDGYGDFCSGNDRFGVNDEETFSFLVDTNVDKSLVTLPLINKTLEDNPIYSTPILVISGE